MPARVGRFEIIERLGVGGFGTVYLAHDPELEREVAVKVPHPHLLDSEKDRARYLREAKTAARLRHANIVPLFEASIKGDELYIVSAFVKGQTLDARLRQRRTDLTQAIRWVIKLARALDYAHSQGVIHRDVKPHNVMLDEQDEPLLLDFGLARLEASNEMLTQLDSVLGTPAYMSPEQAAGRLEMLSGATDQYSLGVLLYELLCGERPFSGPAGLVISKVINQDPMPPSERNSAIPAELEAICLRMMSKRIEHRFASLTEAATALEKFASGKRQMPPRPLPLTTPVVAAVKVETPALEPPSIQPPSVQPTALARTGQRIAERKHPLLIATTVVLLIGFFATWWIKRGTAAPDPLTEADQSSAQRHNSAPSTLADPPAVPAVPPSALSPFTAEEASVHQAAWATHLGQPVEITNSIGMKLRLIPPGEFMMGSPEDEEGRYADETQHLVRLTKPYHLGTYEVTQQEYSRVMGSNPSHFSTGGDGRASVLGLNTDRFPVETVSWEDATEFCRRLSAMPAERSLGRVYRLPTEAEWEYACRAGTTIPFHFGSVLDGTQANIDGNYPFGTSAPGPFLARSAQVGSYAANGFGLFDMHGNVWEWCSDWYDGYGLGTVENLAGRSTDSSRVRRGGSWFSGAWIGRSAYRSSFSPGLRGLHLGFRVASDSVDASI